MKCTIISRRVVASQMARARRAAFIKHSCAVRSNVPSVRIPHVHQTSLNSLALAASARHSQATLKNKIWKWRVKSVIARPRRSISRFPAGLALQVSLISRRETAASIVGVGATAPNIWTFGRLAKVVRMNVAMLLANQSIKVTIRATYVPQRHKGACCKVAMTQGGIAFTKNQIRGESRKKPKMFLIACYAIVPRVTLKCTKFICGRGPPRPAWGG